MLGYSALEFGASFVITPVAAAAGMIVAQVAIQKVGCREVAATGMALIGAGSLLLTQVSVGGSYFGDVFLGIFVFGLGIGPAFATATTVAVSRSEDYLAANGGANPLLVLTEGFQAAFLACGVLAAIGVALALLLPGRPRVQERVELAPRLAVLKRLAEEGGG